MLAVSKSTVVAVFVLFAIKPCNGEECGSNCAIKTKSQIAGAVEDDEVSLLQLHQVTDKPPHRSPQPATTVHKPVAESIAKEVSETDESSLLDLEHKPSRISTKHSKGKTSGKSIEKFLEIFVSVKNGVMKDLNQFVFWLSALLILGLASLQFSTKSMETLRGNFWNGSPAGLLSSVRQFTQEYLNRLLLMLGAALLLNTGMALLKFFTPDDAKAWHMWQVVLFTIVAFSLMVLFAMAFSYFKESQLGPDASEGLRKFFEQTENSIMTANGFILAHVWLDRYPIPTKTPFWFPVVIFLGFNAGTICFEYVKRNVFWRKDGSKYHYEQTRRIIDIVKGVVYMTGTFAVVGYIVTDVRELADVPEGKQPPTWLGVVCMLVSLMVVFASPAASEQNRKLLEAVYTGKVDLAASLTWTEEPIEWITLPGVFGSKCLDMVNNLFLFTTATIILQNLTMTDEYTANVWELSFLFILVGAVLLTVLQLYLSLLDDNMKNMLTTLCGFLAGKMVAACFVVLLVEVAKMVWLPIAIGWLILAALLESLRKQIYDWFTAKEEEIRAEESRVSDEQ